MGICALPEDRGIFPVYDDLTALSDPTSLPTEEKADYRSEDKLDDEDVTEIDDLVGRKWIRKFSSIRQAKNFVKGRMILSKLIVLVRDKKSKDDQGRVITKTKRRLLLNLKRSGITNASVKAERVELPRVLDVLFDGLELLKHGRRGHVRAGGLRQLVLDFRHAFFNWPNREDELRYFAARLRGEVLVWLRSVQGSRVAPLISGRGLALAMRLVDALVPSSILPPPMSTTR